MADRDADTAAWSLHTPHCGTAANSVCTFMTLMSLRVAFAPAELGRDLGGFLGRFAMKYIMAWAPFAVTLQVR